MDARAVVDPRAAVGGEWERIGQLQVELLKEMGLRPPDDLLDIGCGSLRGGVPIVDYLLSGKYWGTEISSQLLRKGQAHLEEAGLGHKKPRLFMANDFSLREVEGRKFEFVQAFGVFTDIPRELVAECLKSVAKVLAPGGVFLATFAFAKEYRPDHVGLRFRYPRSFFKSLEDQVGLDIKFLPGFSFRHPKGHSLLVATHRR